MVQPSVIYLLGGIRRYASFVMINLQREVESSFDRDVLCDAHLAFILDYLKREEERQEKASDQWLRSRERVSN